MFVREKNRSPECNNIFGPDSHEFNELENKIETEDIDYSH